MSVSVMCMCAVVALKERPEERRTSVTEVRRKETSAEKGEKGDEAL